MQIWYVTLLEDNAAVHRELGVQRTGEVTVDSRHTATGSGRDAKVTLIHERWKAQRRTRRREVPHGARFGPIPASTVVGTTTFQMGFNVFGIYCSDGT